MTISFINRISSIVASVLFLIGVNTVLSAPLAYVPNEKSGSLSVIDTETDSVIATIPAGKKPRGLAFSKLNKLL
ncbi:hypothetical protein ABTM24_19890, partial [Acinetobacter baumannii]